MTKSEVAEFLSRCEVADDTEIFVIDETDRKHVIKSIAYHHTKDEDTILIEPSVLVTDGKKQ